MKSGLDRVVANPTLLENLGRVGLVTNQAVTSSEFAPAAEIIAGILSHSKTSKMVAVFGPQHGYGQTEQDNMIETPDGILQTSERNSIPLFSLYSETRIPTPEQVDLVDTFIIDFLDIGCRVYTYMLTLAGCLQAAAKAGKKIVVLDRPNPLGLSKFDKNTQKWLGVEGNRIDLKWKSFVGWYEIPMRHGLTLGELGNYFIKADKLNLDYKVIEVEGLTRSTHIEELSKTPWTLPSPNIPSWNSALFFPSFVTLEGTNISEGRGSTLPFQLVGAPFLNSNLLALSLNSCSKSLQKQGPDRGFSGCTYRPHDFRPTFNKHQGQICKGLHFQILDAQKINTFDLGMNYLAECIDQGGEKFQWKAPGYEYNYTDSPLLLILGDKKWLDLFDGIKNNGLNLAFRAKLDETLQWAYNDAQLFALESQFSHLY